MASIKGFQMKNIKKTLGREGEGCIASLYLNGKIIGIYEDYGDGGMEDVNYVSKDAEKEMMKVIIEFAKEYKNDFIIDLYKQRPEQFKSECERFKTHYPYIPDEDITIQTMASNSIVYIVSEFLNLWELEKQYKKYSKKGYKAISVNKEKNGLTTITAYPNDWSDEIIKEKAKNNKVYFSLNDFII